MSELGRALPHKVAILACAVALARGVHGGEPSTPPQVDYQAMLKSGTTQFEKGDYVAAISTWERLVQSLGQARGWKVLYNLGLAYEAIGDATFAMDRFGAFVHTVDSSTEPAAEGIAERRADALDRMDRIRATHGEVRIRPSSSAIVLVRVDNGPERPAGFTAWLLPGEHRIEIGCGTDALRREILHVEAGKVMDVVTARDIAPVPSAVPSPAPTPVPHPSATGASSALVVLPNRPFPTAWVLAGAGATALSTIVPIVLGLRAKDKRDAALELGPGHTQYSGALDDYNAARRAYQVSYVLPATLAAVTLGIAGVHWLSPNSPGQIKASALLSPEGGALWAAGTF